MIYNILVNFSKNALVYIILIVNVTFLTLLDQFSSCNIILLWNFMTHFRFSSSFLANFSVKFNLLVLCGDIESISGPRPNSGQSFSICHWNLSSIAAHYFSKINLLRAYNAIHILMT